jgi:hypothetical protein
MLADLGLPFLIEREATVYDQKKNNFNIGKREDGEH